MPGMALSRRARHKGLQGEGAAGKAQQDDLRNSPAQASRYHRRDHPAVQRDDALPAGTAVQKACDKAVGHQLKAHRNRGREKRRHAEQHRAQQRHESAPPARPTARRRSARTEKPGCASAAACCQICGIWPVKIRQRRAQEPKTAPTSLSFEHFSLIRIITLSFLCLQSPQTFRCTNSAYRYDSTWSILEVKREFSISLFCSPSPSCESKYFIFLTGRDKKLFFFSFTNRAKARIIEGTKLVFAGRCFMSTQSLPLRLPAKDICPFC